jgi:hypothetical protein
MAFLLYCLSIRLSGTRNLVMLVLESVRGGRRDTCREGWGEGGEGGLEVWKPRKRRCGMAIAVVNACLEGSGERKRIDGW